MTIKISPSIVSAPLLKLEAAIRALEAGGADMIHFDIEDGCFVPVMNLGVKTVSELRTITDLTFDVHLMMVNPEWIISELANCGVDRLSVHYEACAYPRRILKKIAGHGLTAGLAFNPKTPLPDLNFCFPYLSYVVLLTTEPEGGSDEYLPSVLGKVRQNKPAYQTLEWVIDGGVNLDNILEVCQAGADVVVSGRGVFGNTRIKENIKAMKNKCRS